MFPIDLTVALTGVTEPQLAGWRRGLKPVLAPEFGTRPRVLYSYRDLVALRTFARLRSEAVPLQRIRRALQALDAQRLHDHPSAYRLVAHGQDVALLDDDGTAMDLSGRPGQGILSMKEVFDPFVNLKGRRVADFRHPRARLAVKPGRLGGWPTIRDTRVPYETVAELVLSGEVDEAEVPEYYPTVGVGDVADAVDFYREVHPQEAA